MLTNMEWLFLFLMLSTARSANTGFIPKLNITLLPFAGGGLLMPKNYNYTKDHRHNFCGVLQSVIAGKLTMDPSKSTFALKGLTLTIGVAPPNVTDVSYMSYNDTSGWPSGGFFYTLHSALAAAGGYSVSFVQVPVQPDIYSNKQYLQWITPHLDLYGGEVFSDAVPRRVLNIGFTQALVDYSQILVVKQGKAVPAFALFSFAKPFSSFVWLLIAVMLMLNGMIFSLFREHTETETNQEFFLFSFLAFMSNTFEVKPPRSAGLQLLTVVFCFCIFIFSASYTGAVASFLISAQTATTSLTSIDDANTKRSRICVVKGSNSQTTLSTYYPLIQQVTVNEYSVQGLYHGLCDGAVVTVADFLIAQTRANQDGDCNIVQVGGAIRKVSGAWAFQSDFSSYCTSFLNDALSVLLLNMAAAGTLDMYFQSAIAVNNNVQCPPIVLPSTNALTYVDLSGVFVMYICAVGAMLVMVGSERGFVLLARYKIPEKFWPKWVALRIAEQNEMLENKKLVEEGQLDVYDPPYLDPQFNSYLSDGSQSEDWQGQGQGQKQDSALGSDVSGAGSEMSAISGSAPQGTGPRQRVLKKNTNAYDADVPTPVANNTC